MNEFNGARKLRRSADHRIIAGVCGGIAEYLNVDANLIRLAFVVFTLFALSGVLLYILAWLLMPEEGTDGSLAEQIVRNFQGKRSDY